jgi:adenylate cyclase
MKTSGGHLPFVRSLTGGVHVNQPPTLHAQEKRVAVLFVDIEGCTRLCEDLPPKTMNGLIERYFSRFFDGVEKTGGRVNNIMGDGFMGLFEAEEYRRNILSAAEAAVIIQRRCGILNKQSLGKHDSILMNAGIHAGSAYVGITNFLTLNGKHWTYTASGPVINIAARLCDLATNGSIFVSAEVAENLEGTGYSLQQLGPKKLKNVSQPVRVFKLEDK